MTGKYKFNLPALLTVAVLALCGFGFTAIPAHAAIDGDYSEYDYDNDMSLNEDEWFDYSYDAIDYDDDGLIGEDEWEDYTTVWYEPLDDTYDEGVFGDYDMDEDGYLDEDEYAEAYDGDLFAFWDDSDDGIISNNEYDTLLDMYDDPGEGGLFDW